MNRSSWLKMSLVAALGALAMLALPAVSAAKDRNNDRIPDRWEKRHHLSLNVKQTTRDQDRDHLRNRQEFLADTDPRDRDSDDDGVTDGDENAGRIHSFDTETNRLVIDLFGGDTVSGLVTDQTEIECDDDHSATASEEEDVHSSEPTENESGEEHSEEGEDHEADEVDGDSEDGDHEDGDHEDGGNCATADLKEGTVVEEAELKLQDGNAVFEEIELG